MDPTLLINDIKEKETKTPQAPVFPEIKSSTSGFPEHKKRTKISAFKQRRQGIPQPETKPSSVFTTASNAPLSDKSNVVSRSGGPSTGLVGQENMSEEKRSIDRENNDRLASMSAREIEDARQQLFNGLDPKILEMLLRRPTLDEKQGPSPFNEPSTSQKTQPPPEIRIEDTSKKIAPDEAKSEAKAEAKASENTTASSTIDQEVQPTLDSISKEKSPSSIDDAAPPVPPTEHVIANDAPSTHFPAPPVPQDVDPSDPNFLSLLHEKYFPNLPADPAKLAWMAPVPSPNSPADYDSPYHPSQSSIPISQLRFDFRGKLLPPRISRAIPVNKGLHHHGEAPEAAGYTITELARFCRSAVPGQRCIAYQTLGRIMFRLGQGEFGRDDMAKGIWASMAEGKAMESLYEEAGMDPDAGSNQEGNGRGRGHRSAYAYAVEAIWLYEKGGWREKLRRGK